MGRAARPIHLHDSFRMRENDEGFLEIRESDKRHIDVEDIAREEASSAIATEARQEVPQISEEMSLVQDYWNIGTLGIKEIADQLEMSIEEVLEHVRNLRTQGAHLREGTRTARQAELRVLLAEGVALNQIAGQMDVGRPTLEKDIADMFARGEDVDIKLPGNPQQIERRHRLFKLYNEGVECEPERFGEQSPLAEELGIAQSTLEHEINLLRRYGFPMPKRYKRDTDPVVAERRAKVKALWNEGKNTGQIAQATGIDFKLVNSDLNVLRREDPDLRPTGRASRSEVAARRVHIKRLRDEGFKRKEIAEQMGMTVTEVSADLTALRKIGMIEGR